MPRASTSKGVYGPADVWQKTRSLESEWQLQSAEPDGLHILLQEGTTLARVRVDLTGWDTIVLQRDGAILVPERAWVDVDGETLAEVCVLDCEVPHG